MILYFSATGNSEYVAKYIAHLNNDKVVNMTDYLKRNEPMNLTSETPYVIVAPVYISTMPVIVMDLLKQSKFEGNNIADFLASGGYVAYELQSSATSRQLYEAYRNWCEDNATRPLSDRTFWTYLREHALELDISYTNTIPIGGGKYVRGFKGIRVCV